MKKTITRVLTEPEWEEIFPRDAQGFHDIAKELFPVIYIANVDWGGSRLYLVDNSRIDNDYGEYGQTFNNYDSYVFGRSYNSGSLDPKDYKIDSKDKAKVILKLGEVPKDFLDLEEFDERD